MYWMDERSAAARSDTRRKGELHGGHLHEAGETVGTVVPKQERSVRTREKIRRAAVQVFSEKGPHGARVADIARRARVNKQRIYAYFGSKAELHRQVLLAAYSEVAHNDRLAGLADADVPVLTETIVGAFFDFHEENPMFWRLLSWENLNGGGSLQPGDWEGIRSAYITHLRVLYEAGQARGCFRPDVGFNAYILLLFSITSFYFANQLTISRLLGLDLRSGTVRQRIQRQVVRLVTAGVASAAGPGHVPVPAAAMPSSPADGPVCPRHRPPPSGSISAG